MACRYTRANVTESRHLYVRVRLADSQMSSLCYLVTLRSMDIESTALVNEAC